MAAIDILRRDVGNLANRMLAVEDQVEKLIVGTALKTNEMMEENDKLKAQLKAVQEGTCPQCCNSYIITERDLAIDGLRKVIAERDEAIGNIGTENGKMRDEINSLKDHIRRLEERPYLNLPYQIQRSTDGITVNLEILDNRDMEVYGNGQ